MRASSLASRIIPNPWITSTKGSAYKSCRTSDRCNLQYYLREPDWRRARSAGVREKFSPNRAAAIAARVA